MYILYYSAAVSGVLLRTILGLPQDKISVKRLDDNPGVLPVRLGNAKIRDYSYTLIHYYDLNPIIVEINKLHLKSLNITTLLNSHTEYLSDTADYLKILKLTQDRVENKIKEIIPHPNRVKRGLINMLGSVFKVVTGNLDASDGERYDRIITELQSNQNRLSENILNQNSLSLNVITKFNDTIIQISKHEQLLESKIKQISLIVQKTTYRENSIYIKIAINAIINIYEFIDSLLQDIENSITFCKLKIMHPSIIKTVDLYTELKSLESRVGVRQLPLPIELETVFLFEKLIDIECFIVNNKVTYLLHIPITSNENFEIFQLYSAPILSQSRFKVILPRSKFIIRNKLHYTYRSQACQEISTEQFLCEKNDLKEIQKNSPCEVRLLASAKDTSTCEQVEIQISQPIINQLASSSKWLLVLPSKEIVKLKCVSQEEEIKLLGTYILDIPNGCQVSINEIFVIAEHKPVNNSIQPILFPDLGETPKMLPLLNLSFHLDDLKLDSLQEIRNEIIAVRPNTTSFEIAKVPSLWTVLIYGLLTIGCTYLIYKKWYQTCRISRTVQEETRSHQPVQLPQMV